MPIQVPRFTGPSVAPAPLPAVRVTPGHPSLGPDLTGAVNTLEDVVRNEQEKADQMRVLDAAGQLTNLETGLLTHARSQHGTNALNVVSDVRTEWDKRASEIQDGLANDRQKLAIRRMTQDHWASLYAGVQQHVTVELERFDDEKTTAYVVGERKAALDSFTDPARVQTSIVRQQAAWSDYGSRKGMPAEWIANQRADAASKTHIGVLNGWLAAKKDLTAKEYFDAHQAELTGDDRQAAQQAVHEGSVRGESQRLADDIMGTTRSLSDAIEMAKKRAKDPEVRDETVRRLRQEYSEQQESLRIQRQTDFIGDLNLVKRAGGRLDVIPAAHASNYTLEERTGMREYALQIQKGVPPITDWSLWYQRMRQAASADPKDREAFIKTNLFVERSRYADPQFEQLTTLQRDIAKSDAAAEEKLGRFRTLNQIVRSSAVQAGVIPANAKEDDHRVTELFRRVEEEAQRQEQATGKPLRSEEMQHIVDGLLLQGTITGSGWFGSSVGQTKRRAYQLNAGEAPNFTVEHVPYQSIPPAERADLEQRIKDAGGAVTNDRVERAYAAALMQNKALLQRIMAER